MQDPHTQFCQRCAVIHIGGRVQGVGFRFSTYQKAKKLALVGYVKNLISGEVEIVACGSKSQVDSLIQWLEAGGPISAKIAYYDVNEIEAHEHYTSFTVRY